MLPSRYSGRRVEALNELVVQALEARNRPGFDARLDQRLHHGYVRVTGKDVARVFDDDALPPRARDELPS
jgi:hypothetical protein